jgi:hypothetical protein
MTDQHPLIPACTGVNQIINQTLGKIDASTTLHIRSIAGAAVETILRHPRRWCPTSALRKTMTQKVPVTQLRRGDLSSRLAGRPLGPNVDPPGSAGRTTEPTLRLGKRRFSSIAG